MLAGGQADEGGGRTSRVNWLFSYGVRINWESFPFLFCLHWDSIWYMNVKGKFSKAIIVASDACREVRRCRDETVNGLRRRRCATTTRVFIVFIFFSREIFFRFHLFRHFSFYSFCVYVGIINRQKNTDSEDLSFSGIFICLSLFFIECQHSTV